MAWALMTAFAPRRAIAPSAALLCSVALLGSLAPVKGQALEIAFLGCWVAVIALAAGIHLPRGVPLAPAIAGGAFAGLWTGLVVAAEGSPRDLLMALPCGLVALPARWIVDRGWAIALKVVSSWLIAVALLAALLPTTHTPGYVPDHMD